MSSWSPLDHVAQRNEVTLEGQRESEKVKKGVAKAKRATPCCVVVKPRCGFGCSGEDTSVVETPVNLEGCPTREGKDYPV